MKALKGLLALFFLSCIIEASFFTLYRYEATGPLKEAIEQHTTTLTAGIAPEDLEIYMQNTSWTEVARFEEIFGELHLIVDPIFALIITWFFMRRGVSVGIRNATEKMSQNRHLRRAFYLCLNVVSGAFIFMPQVVSGYLIGHLRGTDTTMPADAIYTVFSDPVISSIYTLALFIPLYWIIDRTKGRWWIIAAAFVALFSVTTAFIEPVVIEPLYVQAAPLEEGALKNAIVEMTQKAGVPIERVYVNNTSWQSLESNAGVTGIGWTKRIELDDTLINYYTQSEIVFIIAHELGHYVRGDLILDAIIAAFSTCITFWLISRVLRFWIRKYGRKDDIRGENDIALFPLFGLVFLVFGFVASPIISTISRAVEARADTYSLDLTHDPASGISGFKKLGYQSFVDPSPPALLHFWFDTHPSLDERIEALSRK